MTNDEMEANGIVPCAYRFEACERIKVEWRGTGLWAVTNGGACYNTLGEWEVEPMPSSRTEDFFERCRYPLDEALRVGVKAVAEELAMLEEWKKRRESKKDGIGEV